MGRLVGTISRGLRAPIIKQGDDISDMIPIKDTYILSTN